MVGKELSDGGSISIQYGKGGKFLLVLQVGSEQYRWKDAFDSYRDAKIMMEGLVELAVEGGARKILFIFEGNEFLKKIE